MRTAPRTWAPDRSGAALSVQTLPGRQLRPAWSVSVRRPAFSMSFPASTTCPPLRLPDYWIDRHEVTNREFKRFLDDGGYRRPEFWREPFVKDGTELTFDDAAMTLSATRQGSPVRRRWELGAYPAGQDDYPVAGVSWYEAAAYARWAGKSLPTIYHWSRVADQRTSGQRRARQQLRRQGPAGRCERRGGQPRRRVRYGGQRQGVDAECQRRASATSWAAAGTSRVYMFTDPGRAVAVRAGAEHTAFDASRSTAPKT